MRRSLRIGVLALAVLAAGAGRAADEAPAGPGPKAAIKSGAVRVGHGVRDGARTVGHGVRDGARVVGHGVRDGAKAVGHGVRRAVKGD